MVAPARWPRGSVGASLARRSDPPAHDDSWYVDIPELRTAAGVNVTDSLALKCSAVWGCVQVRAQTKACMPPILYRRTTDGRERADDHRLYGLLHDEPNPEMSSFDYWQTTQVHLDLRGNHYSFVERRADFSPMALWPLHPDWVKPERVGRTVVYHYRPPAGQGERDQIPKEHMLHLRGMSGDGVIGYTPIRYAAESIGLSAAAQRYGARFFTNDARTPLLFRHPGEYDEDVEKNITESWERKYAGNPHRVAVLFEGMEAQVIGLHPEDAQMLQTLRAQVIDIARFYRVPLHKLQELDRMIKANIEQQAIEFLTDCMLPVVMRDAAEIKRTLLSPKERELFYPEHLIANYLRADMKTRGLWYALGRQWAWLTINEIRRLENMAPVEGGDELFVPANMTPLQAALESLADGTDDEGGGAEEIVFPPEDEGAAAPARRSNGGRIPAALARGLSGRARR